MICPEILRQRLIIEGIHGIGDIDEATIRDFLAGLTRHLRMTPIADTLIFSPDAVSRLHHGIGGYQAWAESGCSLYTWRTQGLFTLDIYSCRRFATGPVIHFIDQALLPRRLDWRHA